MRKARIITGIMVFGSVWGLAECLLGQYFSGAVMTGLIALGLMALSRSIYERGGMQLAMGVVAGVLRATVPLGQCVLCSAIAIVAEGAIFELIWLAASLNLKKEKNFTILISAGVVAAYLCYGGGYVITQMATSLVSSVPFKLSEIAMLLPQIFSRATLAGLLGGITLPVLATAAGIKLSPVRKEAYYPVASLITAACWMIALFLI